MATAPSRLKSSAHICWIQFMTHDKAIVSTKIGYKAAKQNPATK